ncbi:MAG: ATP-binding protein [Advenella sp.]
MAIKLRSTREVHANGVKALVYGASGVGKTTLIKTLPDPIIISAEGGLLSLSDMDIPFIEVATMEDLREAFAYVRDSEHASVALDSISEIGDVVLHAEKATAKDPRQAYGALQDVMGEMIRAFRDIEGKHVLFTAKIEKTQDEQGRVLYGPSMPGNKLPQALPFFFDIVLALRAERDQEGVTQRALMTDTDGLWTAKARTTDATRLLPYEAPDMGAIIGKLQGGKE